MISQTLSAFSQTLPLACPIICYSIGYTQNWKNTLQTIYEIIYFRPKICVTLTNWNVMSNSWVSKLKLLHTIDFQIILSKVRIPLSPLEAIFKEVQSPQIVDFRALFILLPHQITPIRSKNQWVIHESNVNKKMTYWTRDNGLISKMFNCWTNCKNANSWFPQTDKDTDAYSRFL